MSELCMPRLGAGMEAGTVVRWLRKAGDRVRRGDVIAEVETEKGVIDVEVFEDGVIEALLVEEGAKVSVGAAIARVGGEPRPAPAKGAPPARTTPSARHLAHEAGVDLGAVRPTGGHDTVTRRDVARAIEERAPGRVRASPLARRRAAELGLDLGRVPADPFDGAVHVRDVERAAAARAPTAPAGGMRRAIAAAMAQSKREIPHYYVATAIDFGPTRAWLDAANAARSVTGRLIPAALLLRAVVLALRDVPELNARWTGEAAPPIADVHLGVAIALRGGGLIAPAIPHADRLDTDGLMRALEDLVRRARTGHLRSGELGVATITVTSLGERGVDAVFPIIHPPQVAMVGFGRIVERAWVVDGELRPRPIITATLSADHRVSDGHRGALFLAAIEAHLRRPEGS